MQSAASDHRLFEMSGVRGSGDLLQLRFALTTHHGSLMEGLHRSQTKTTLAVRSSYSILEYSVEGAMFT